ncbi:hypothetical protein Tco_0400605 [Tanacetum coccineum]
MTSSNNQMHNDIMAAGFKERPPMLAIVRKVIDAEAEAVHMILNGICNNIYSIVDAFPNAKETWTAIEPLQNRLVVDTMQINVQFLQQLQPKWTRFMKIVKQQKDMYKVSYHTLFDILKQQQNEVNDIRTKRIARNANPLVLVAATQQHIIDYYQAPQAPKSYKPHAPSSRQKTSTRSHDTTRSKGKEIVKPPSPPFKSAFKEDSDEEQAQRDKQIHKSLHSL